MLSSITPLGQRGRGMSWGRTVVGFWFGATLAGAALFSAAGLVGSLIGLESLNPWFSLIVIAAAAVLDIFGMTAPGPQRQVNEDWLGMYRDWVTGFGFGTQLGLGFMTIVPSFGYWAILLVAAASGLPLATLIGIGFGVGRSLLLVGTRGVGSTPALANLMRRFNMAESSAKWASFAGYAVVIAVVVINVA